MHRLVPLLCLLAGLILGGCAACDASRLDAAPVHIVAIDTTSNETTTSLHLAPPDTADVAPPHQSKPRAARSQIQGPRIVAFGDLACGGDLPPCWVMMRESHGDPRAVNPRGCGGRSCGGKWQFDPWSWRGMCGKYRCADYQGYAFAQDAPAKVQDDKAREVWAGGAGCRHWAAC